MANSRAPRRKAKCDPSVVTMLTELRGGKKGAAEKLGNHFQKLVDELAKRRNSDGANPNKLGVVYEGMRTAIRRLASNDVAAAGVEKYLRDEMIRAIRDAYAEERLSRISPPASTISTQKSEGLPVAKGLSRRLSRFEDKRGDCEDRRTDRLELPHGCGAYEAATGCPDEPHKRDISSDPRHLDRRLDLTSGSRLDGRILELADVGRAVATIAAYIGQSFKQVEGRLKHMRELAKALGYRPPVISKRHEEMPDDSKDDCGRQIQQLIHKPHCVARPHFATNRKRSGRAAKTST
jgi:hypothetical protein